MTIYTKLGPDGIKAVVADFYDRVLASEDLATYFYGVNMASQRRHLAALLSKLTGGPDTYHGTDMARAHQGLNITNEHFDLVVGYLAAALEQARLSEEDIAAVRTLADSLRPEIVGA